MNAQISIKEMAIAAKKATFAMRKLSLKERNSCLKSLIDHLIKNQDKIFEANQKDIVHARANGLSGALLERLSLEGHLQAIIQDIKQVINLPDPLGEVFDQQILPNQLKIAKCPTPIGVIGVIFESRPNVVLDISILTIKSGNCVVLKGGSESLHTNQIIVEMIQKALVAASFPKQAVQLITCIERTAIKELLQLDKYIDLIIPRGGSALQQFCRENSTIPMIAGGIGICHLFVDETANLERSLAVILNAKTQRPTVCNALNTLLVHSSIASRFIPEVVKTLMVKGVTFCLDEISFQLVKEPCCKLALPADWNTEWLSLVLNIRVVENLKEAIEHIQRHGTDHSDGILTENTHHAEQFIKQIDSSAVYVNASTRFTDGGQLGLGAEVACSTQKIHARGPMGLKELTSYKWVIQGNYQIRD